MADSPKERLLAATMDYVTKHGIGELTLRQLAAALGTSHRMLVYHFGSKEGLLTEVVRRSEAEQRQFTSQLLADSDQPPIDQARRIWQQLAQPEMAPRERLFFEVYAQALQGRPHTRALLDEIVETWLEPLIAINRQNGMPPAEAAASARLGLAVTRGLLLDLLATGDHKGTSAAMEHFLTNYLPLVAPVSKSRGTQKGKRKR
ncbi:MAG TPA: TetR/AcrR family transcriptional regulator [Magnetospirillaceae bacterium]|jgi:AcrR family transcriptional regulator